MHFCVRDVVFDHITRITNKDSRLNGHKVFEHFGNASVIFGLLFVIMTLYMYILSRVITIPQLWLQNLEDTCEKEFETDDNGKFVPNMKFFFLQHILNYTFYFAILGFYLGQLMLSYKGHDIPEIDTFSSCSAFVIRLLISLCGVTLCGLPIIIGRMFIMKMNLWLNIICLAAIP